MKTTNNQKIPLNKLNFKFNRPKDHAMFELIINYKWTAKVIARILYGYICELSHGSTI